MRIPQKYLHMVVHENEGPTIKYTFVELDQMWAGEFLILTCLVELAGFEPATSSMPLKRSPN